MQRYFTRLLHQDTGTTSIEYALIAVLVSIAIITSLQMLGTNLQSIYQAIADAFSSSV